MSEVLSDSQNVNLLWTGGWDSTFQLLQLLLIHRRRVTPLYLIDAERRSTGVELLTMKRIKDHLWNEHPHTRELLQPTRYGAVEDVSPDSEITNAYQSIRKRKHIGSQYDWLARFCKENGLADVQIGITCCSHPGHFTIGQFLLERPDGAQTTFSMDPRFKETNEYVLFHRFSFPLTKLDKKQMAALAEERGWEKIMSMTWFCHKPTQKGKPCGKCTPCIQLIRDGLGWRIPAKSRLVSLFHRYIIEPLKPLVRRMLSRLGVLKYVHKTA
ncbi:MAG: 7-cyano-7-deazaguanine synthase [Planctomycetota bacterium]|nr:7-cyano-7-deazaguanine synthase [Planctomycetota bacterium]